MTNRVGNKNQAQLRGKQERKEIKQANREREVLKQTAARAKHRKAVKGQPQLLFFTPSSAARQPPATYAAAAPSLQRLHLQVLARTLTCQARRCRPAHRC
jgi:hypothetical protein